MMRIVLFLTFCLGCSNLFAQNLPKPSAAQLAWQKLETTAFLHFTVNTFTDKEWGDGTESPSIFNPVKLDARQWVAALKEGGFKMCIITAKHHDGFCLWPSKYTDHSVKSSPWKNGQGDVVKDVADACREFGLKFGFYLSPWDQHEKSYGTDQYNDFYKSQLKELLTNYGIVHEVWFDGARGPNAKDMQYDFKGYWDLVKQYQPQAVCFSDVGPGVRWVGNESGNAGETCWSPIITLGMAPGVADSKYLNTGDEQGTEWIPAETDVSIRPGWFYHPKEDDKVRSPQNLVNLYYQSVGRNSLLLLNVPPNREGLLCPQDVASIVEYRSILNETFKTNLAKSGKNKKLVDQKLETWIAAPENSPLEIKLPKSATFDRFMLQENIAEGQRIAEAQLEYWDGTTWKLIRKFTTVGYKRLLRFDPVTTTKLRLTVLRALAPAQVAELGVYKASSRE
ncbi:alpha-L-fucosidase [Haliscomenobacter hydrossis]|uniref:alpha-L-fucosidase n=1 Tax=Haliscomenobacter hydrossis (strain ATCC 27775 / DSM 1100 / LMG 10767 / O) TaxID=760192 RepID=F4KRS2_HALH1|nr:alpha-L-fucosidase [Haliscomenobacter hydrossis]AEE50026.1 Alpha-L-fucosidase [Haliscomenobacter hydrossis DSM 1100]